MFLLKDYSLQLGAVSDPWAQTILCCVGKLQLLGSESQLLCDGGESGGQLICLGLLASPLCHCALSVPPNVRHHCSVLCVVCIS